MRLRILTCLGLAITVTACVDQLDTPDGRFGSISVTAFDGGGIGSVLNLEAAFYGETDLEFAQPASDSCFTAQYFETNAINTNLRYLNVGEFVRVRTGTRVDSMFPISGLPVRVYQTARTRGIPYTPGDSVYVDVEGSGNAFPQASISVKTSEPFTNDAVGVPAEGVDLTLNWTPAPAPGSLMTYSLRYANAFSAGTKNEQLFCAFVDDGSATVPAAFLVGWRTALNNNREAMVVRLRTRQLELDSRTKLLIASTYSQPLSPLEP